MTQRERRTEAQSVGRQKHKSDSERGGERKADRNTKMAGLSLASKEPLTTALSSLKMGVGVSPWAT